MVQSIGKKVDVYYTVWEMRNLVQSGQKYYVYVGSYTRKEPTGVYVCELDTATGELKQIGGIDDVKNPSFLRLDASRDRLYAIGERGDSDGQSRGAVSAYIIDRETGQLAFINQISTESQSLCHISLDLESQYMVGTSYRGGTAFIASLTPDGSLSKVTETVQHSGSGPVTNRQDKAHAHSAIVDPTNRFVFVCDLGIDKIVIYEIDRTNGKLKPHGEAVLHPGAGPRHFLFDASGKFAYVINELDSSVTAFSYDGKAGALHTLQTIAGLPESFSGEKNTAADIHLSPDGKFLYGSQRGHDSIVVYAVDPASGKLEYVEHASTLGRIPRNFAITPDGGYLLAANQDTGNVVVFRVDRQTGKLTPTGAQLQLSEPVCVEVLPN
jgi:6-phosphogluconolactonase